MALKTDTTISLFSQKKLLGKAHTSNKKLDGEEIIGSNIQTATSLIFGEEIPKEPTLDLYQLQGALGSPSTVEYIQFNLVPIEGTVYAASSGGGGGSDTGETSQEPGTHGYAFKLPSTYEQQSVNPKAGKGIFNNNTLVHTTLGALQLVPPFFSQKSPNPYVIKIYKDNGAGGLGEEIPLLDDIDWSVDYYNGILFVQDYKSNSVPMFARAFAYVGKMSNEVIGIGGGGGTTYATNVLIQTSWMEVPSGDVDGLNMQFYLANDPQPTSALQLYVNGVLQRQGESFDYTIGDNLIQMNYSPPEGSRLLATYPYLYFLPTSTAWAEVPIGLTNGTNSTFTIANTPSPPTALMLYVNGVLQLQGPAADYTFDTSTNTISMRFTPPVGSSLIATYPY